MKTSHETKLIFSYGQEILYNLPSISSATQVPFPDNDPNDQHLLPNDFVHHSQAPF